MAHPQSATVGILLRTKDRPLFLDRALKKIKAQSYPHWHIHLLNDGGNEEQIQTVLAQHDEAFQSHVTVMHNTASVGRGRALSQLLCAASETYLLLHDDDDYLEPDFLRVTVNFLEKPENKSCAGVVTSNSDIIEAVTPGGLRELSRDATSGKRTNGYISFLSFLSQSNGVFPPISTLFRKSAVKDAKTDSYTRNYNEDVDLFIDLMKHGELATLDETLAVYSIRAANTEDDTTRPVKEEQTTLYMNSKIREALSEGDTLNTLRSLLNADRGYADYTGALLQTSHEDIIKHIVESNIHIQKNIKLLAEILENLNRKVSSIEKNMK
ncbi:MULTISPECIES: glycosyltransferase [unclassified Saccharibacter]|uniref:glycosyltransferase n=1 Tax=unclassified Saccharibacter TaxID=2648722 RepID=UPI001329FACF|nr:MULTISPECIES: glycosyltransferase [unclassified Saccharibacter]MXV36084.1 glycosyltransferase [Saccharibacter sp. EH611]MXV56943.1 glycosyltransferase [Saccharibacter sp. EH70]MXV66697.1 glycosyltransferase [Saccharibacter sp. EH60]